MPATGLKIVGTRACLPWCSISSSFQNSLKTSDHRDYEFLEFWNLVPFLPDISFQLLKSLWSSFLFNVALKSLYTPFSIHSAFQNMQAAHTVCTYAPPNCQRCWSGGHSICDFLQECQILTHLTIEHFELWHFHFETLKMSFSGHDAAYGPCSHMASFLHDIDLVGICRWHGGLCLPTVVSGSIPGPNVNDRIMPMSDAVLSEGPKTTGIQQRSSALSLTHRDLSSVSESLIILCTVDDEICKAFAIWHWGTLFLKYSTIFVCFFADCRASAHLYFWETLPL